MLTAQPRAFIDLEQRRTLILRANRRVVVLKDIRTPGEVSFGLLGIAAIGLADLGGRKFKQLGPNLPLDIFRAILIEEVLQHLRVGIEDAGRAPS